ncbi:MAG: MFS transporter [Candidatus Methanomethylophilaceae archaeon]|jgi:MFS family permease
MKGKGEFIPSKWTLLFLLLPSTMIMMGGAVVAPALPAISEAFPEASQTMVSLIVTVPGLAVTTTGFAIGWASDRFGKVRMLALSALITAIGGSAGFFLDSIPLILVSRFAVGVGIGGMTVTTTALISEYYTGNDRIRVISYQSAAMGAGIMFLEVAGGLTADIGWREPFLVYMVAMVFFFGIIMSMREPTTKIVKASGSEKWDRHDTKTVVLCYSAAFLGLMISYILPTNLPYYVSELGASGLTSGILIGWFGVCEAISCMMYRRISTVMDRNGMMVFSFLIAGIGYSLMFIPNSFAIIIVSLALIGFGLGLITPIVINWLSTVVTNNTSGKIMGGYSMALNMAPFASSIISAPLLAAASSSYETMFLLLGMISLIIGALCAVPLLKRKSATE